MTLKFTKKDWINQTSMTPEKRKERGIPLLTSSFVCVLTKAQGLAILFSHGHNFLVFSGS